MLQLGIRGLGIARFKFNPRNWFAKGEQGAWYDPSDLTTLFQESSGVTPMAAVGTVADQPVGLMLDKSKGLALGAELVTNGTFDTDTNWTLPSVAWNITGGTLNYLGIGNAYSKTSQAITTKVGATYQIIFNATAISSGTFYVGYGTAASNLVTTSSAISVAGAYSLCFVATATISYIVVQDNNATQTFSVDNISVKQIAGNHAFQATPANRPILSARVNLLTKTEDFSAAVWVKQAGITVNTNTNLTIPALSAATVYQNIVSIAASTSYTVTVHMQGVAGQTIRIQAAFAGGGSNTDKTLTGGIDVFTIAFTTSATTTNINFGYLNPSAASATLDILKTDLRPTNAGALLPPYQRVNTASDYDSVGFPLYLKCNGTSSAMSTNSIDFTATDKMTVVTGVRKLVDTNYPDIIGYNGTSWIYMGASISGYVFGATGSAAMPFIYLNNAALASPITTVLTMTDSINPPLLSGRVNGLSGAASVSTTQGSGNFGNQSLFLFSRTGTSTYLNGQFYGAIIRGAQSDTASITQTEQYMATKTGITF
jgi:hypothetical protein